MSDEILEQPTSSTNESEEAKAEAEKVVDFGWRHVGGAMV